tara:strand:- start:1393 stop:1926 length:534 start_codon:yes stop_codon:yes gene_type:complete
MKLTKLHLFLILLLVLLFSSLGIGILEGYGIIEGNQNIDDSKFSLNTNDAKTSKKTTYTPDVRVEFKKLVNEKKPMGYGSASGITREGIPPGDEHLYVLKSEIVPPVCPKCPEMKGDCSKKKECPPCPGPERCPEPAFTCKKVPNYSASSVDNVLPSPLFHQGDGVQPILTSFSKFN